MATEPTRRLFTVDEYHRMAETGILTAEDRVELLDGEIIERAVSGPRHAGIVARLTRILVIGLGDRAVVGPQNPVILDDFSEPRPDLSVSAARADDYTTAHPRPADILLLIEVADTSLLFDRNRKLPRYAAVGVPEYWLVDLQHDTIEVYRAPKPNGYETQAVLKSGDVLSPVAFPDLVLSVGDVLR